MTKKDYELIAGAVVRTMHVASWDKNQVRKQAKFEALKLIAHDLSGSLYVDNPKFDREKFLKSCGIQTEQYCVNCGFAEVGHSCEVIAVELG